MTQTVTKEIIYKDGPAG
jgi:hypothetical protein